MSKITEDDVKKVSVLSRLSLPKDKIITYASQLERILTYVEQLGEIDTDTVPPTTRAVEVVNITHEDQVISEDIREELLDLAPQREGDFFRVPKILVS
ncbi:MAG TPA: Asp-tRNA(Asn)/Glu-tRNA(Gln) amidotransferase subunit GatC [Prochlorococcaceae cyanobacterium AMR_MDS_5431]|nr:Asp-tRNA(Asn)/Glu-tRNA(Gln) amidotransferase subunit GatC [Prochlorococcaceae cyanobacterium AMR_MDS_5431]